MDRLKVTGCMIFHTKNNMLNPTELKTWKADNKPIINLHDNTSRSREVINTNGIKLLTPVREDYITYTKVMLLEKVHSLHSILLLLKHYSPLWTLASNTIFLHS
jgi:hypothetical protein